MPSRVLSFASSAVVAAACLVAPAMAAEKVDLRPKLKAGQEHRFAMNVKANTEITMPDLPGMQQKQSMTQDTDYLLRVKEVGEDRSATFEVVYETIKISMDVGPMGTMAFDSSKPAAEDEANPIADSLRPLVGKVITVKVDRDGKVTEVTGGEDLGNAAEQFVGPENLAAQIISPIYPVQAEKGNVEVGQTWSREQTLGDVPFGTLTITTNYKLDSARDNQATVAMDGKLSLGDSKEEGAPKPEFEIKESQNKGQMIWDTAAGMLKSAEQTQRLVLAGDMQGMKVNMTSDTTVKLSRK